MKQVDVLNGKFDVALSLPGSKSITLRDAVLATLAQGSELFLNSRPTATTFRGSPKP